MGGSDLYGQQQKEQEKIAQQDQILMNEQALRKREEVQMSPVHDSQRPFISPDFDFSFMSIFASN